MATAQIQQATGPKYSLGPVKPWVYKAAYEVGWKFGVRTIYGFASRSYTSEHPLGRALDFMVYSDAAKGNAIAGYVQANASRLSVLYIIWQQRIWSPERNSEGWRPMEDRGSPTANHMDHVHVSFNTTAGTGGAVVGDNPWNPANPFGGLVPGGKGVPGLGNPLQGIYDSLGAINQIGEFFSDPNTYIRAALFIVGAIAILMALHQLGATPPLQSATRLAKGAVNAG